MALTREFLTALGIEKEKHQAIIDAHTETTEALKADRDRYKADAEKLPKALEDLKKAQEAAKDRGDYDKLKQEYEDYKADVAKKEALANKKAAMREIAKDAGLSEAGIAKALKYHDYDKLELDEKGAVKEKTAILKGLKEEWPEYIVTTETKGANTATPPAGIGKTRPTKDEIMSIKDDKERQEAIARNLDLFGM